MTYHNKEELHKILQEANESMWFYEFYPMAYLVWYKLGEINPKDDGLIEGMSRWKNFVKKEYDLKYDETTLFEDVRKKYIEKCEEINKKEVEKMLNAEGVFQTTIVPTWEEDKTFRNFKRIIFADYFLNGVF